MAYFNGPPPDDELYAFFTPFFTTDFTKETIDSAYSDDANIQRRILNNIKRLFTLADKNKEYVDKNDGLQIFFWCSAIEAVAKLIHGQTRERKSDIVANFLDTNVLSTDRAFLRDHFRRSLGDPKTDEDGEQIPTKTIGYILYSIRNEFPHEGDYYSFHFGSGDSYPVINNL